MALSAAKHRAKSKRVPFELSDSDVDTPHFCPALGIALNYSVQGTVEPNSPTIDRIVPELGYTRGNVRVISHRANAIKRDASAREIQAVADYVKRETAA